MKETGVIFSGPSIGAILAMQKTQSRRRRGLKALNQSGKMTDCFRVGTEFHVFHPTDPVPSVYRCPFGMPGDRLWVRERWAVQRLSNRLRSVAVEYPATPGADRVVVVPPGARMPRMRARRPDGSFPVRSPLLMPRWAARLMLELVDVRLERLQKLSDADARAEGVRLVPFRPDEGFPLCNGYTFGVDDGKSLLYPTARGAFAVGWDELNGEKEGSSWGADPFVWALTFRLVENMRAAA